MDNIYDTKHPFPLTPVSQQVILSIPFSDFVEFIQLDIYISIIIASFYDLIMKKGECKSCIAEVIS